MTLRGKLVASFVLLGAVPLVAIGVFDYVYSQRALEALVAAQVGALARRAAAELTERQQRQESDLLLLAENAETQRLYQQHYRGDSASFAQAYGAADAYLRRAWELFGPAYRSLALLDSNGRVLYELGQASEHPLDESVPIVRVVRDIDTGETLGELRGHARLDALLPRAALEARFGEAGYSMVIERTSGRVLYHPRHAFMRQNMATLFGSDTGTGDIILDDSVGSFTYRDSDTTRVAAFASIAAPPWTVVVSSTLDEFGAPFARMRTLNLLLVLVVTIAVLAGFILVTRTATRSLGRLTAAADEVGRGNFSPALPAPAHDELGRLTTAFRLMVSKVRDMMTQIESSQQMAAIGEFAAQLSHEIRNPLTSLKLNLQSLKRDVRDGLIPHSSAPPVEIALHEVDRLDRVVRGVLALARPGGTTREVCSLHDVLQRTVDLVRPQLERQHVLLHVRLDATDYALAGSAQQLHGSLLNLLLNGADAMPDGGALTVHTSSGVNRVTGRSEITVRIADTGPGVSPDLRAHIFRPFFTTKPDGTGFGLPIVLRTVEEHGGRIYLAEPERGEGAVFVVVLPLVAAEVHV
ncbi:MAG TPA: ATP-binding protein [Longimicrobiales bacterium]|nr:ATP-binding protein [Longimicrobiales bacterium]